ncbi:hypothetical protein [Flavobacterium sp. XGLA_31]|uniref:hypothetical protein n=1 Tax=Flavobacterium sp. XGLA_31 TaxID=3447666 RepID=UPI003F314FBE
MKTTILSLSILSIMSVTSLFAQDRTTVTANNSEISDNLDLRAVASIFGESSDLNDFERRLNDPKIQISNLDLNDDNKVDYLRVIETVEGNAHLIVIQSVLGRDTYQDIATVEVQRDRDNRVQVQVVGDVYMYGANYIYEPVYVSTPVIYASFWIGNYRPYYSSWYWGYYPTYYYAWEPCPVFRYRSHIGICINTYNTYNYVSYRRCEVAYNSYRARRGCAYETRYPNRSFGVRSGGFVNRYELDKTRNIRTVGTRNELVSNSPRNNVYSNASPRGNGNKDLSSPRANSPRDYESNGNGNRDLSNPRVNSPRSYESNAYGNRDLSNPRGNSPRNYESNGNSPRVNSPRAVEPRENNRAYESPRNNNTQANSPRIIESRSVNNRSYESPRNSAPREMSAPRGNGNSVGNGMGRGNSGNSRRN